MIDQKRIETEAEHFFVWPSDERTYVTRISMLIFAGVIAEMVRAEEREACAVLCERNDTDTPCTPREAGHGDILAAAIRKRSLTMATSKP